MKEFIRNILIKNGYDMHKLYPAGMIRFMPKKENMIGIEIGVLYGYNAKSIFETCSINKLYLIDPYDCYEGFNDTIKENLGKAEIDAKKRLHKYDNKIQWIKKKSEDSFRDIKEKVDFVYIDGNHAYKYVKKDIEIYYQLLKKGGIIGGDNFNNTIDYGVADAVLEFANKNNKKLNFYQDSWWLIK